MKSNSGNTMVAIIGSGYWGKNLIRNYVFVPELGEVTRGMPTGYAGPALSHFFRPPMIFLRFGPIRMERSAGRHFHRCTNRSRKRHAKTKNSMSC